jgi:hypothetical protein
MSASRSFRRGAGRSYPDVLQRGWRHAEPDLYAPRCNRWETDAISPKERRSLEAWVGRWLAVAALLALGWWLNK